MDILNNIAQIIFDKKGCNILALDIRNISTLADYVIIAEGNIDRHLKAIAQAIEFEMKKVGLSPLYVEGGQSGDWIVLDYGDIAIHLFIPEMREKYALEKLWKEGKIVDLKIQIEKTGT